MSELTAQGEDSPMSDYRNLEERLRERHLLGDCVLAAGVIKALMEENARLWEALSDYYALMAENARLRKALQELVALVRGECPRLLDEDRDGDARLSIEIGAALAPQEKGDE